MASSKHREWQHDSSPLVNDFFAMKTAQDSPISLNRFVYLGSDLRENTLLTLEPETFTSLFS